MSVDSQIVACLSRERLAELLAGKLSPVDVAQIFGHVAECEQCRSLVRGAGISSSQLQAVGAGRGTETLSHEQHDPARTDTASRITAAGGTPQTADNLTAERLPLAPPQAAGELGRLGAYRVFKVLGEGGMGIVFEGEDIALGRRVAIKVLRAGEIDTTHRKRFLQEAQLAASLSSDRIVTVHQVGEDNGRLFIVMELLCGESLEARLRQDGWLPLVEALRIAREVAEGLSVAHGKQLVHRDIKPANVWLESKHADELSRRVKLLDFGVARPLAVHDHLTMGGHIVGTPGYMSPEQACGMPIDQRSDLFSLGCLLYAMLAGKAPFERGNYVQTLHAVVDEQPQPLADVLPGLPTKVVRLVERLLDKDAAGRPATARQVVEEIRQIEQSLSTAGLVETRPTTTTTTTSGAHRRRQRLGWGVWIGAAAIIVAALLGSWAEYHRMRELVHQNRQANAESLAAKGDGHEAGAVAVTGAESSTPQVATPSNSGGSATNSATSATSSHSGGEPAGTAPGATGDAGESEGDESMIAPADDPDPNNPPAVIDRSLPPIKVGIVHSLSGPMAASERPIVDAMLMAIADINSQGGLLSGREIIPLVRDGKSNERVFAEQAEDLIVREQVVTLFGCWRSPCRKLVEEVCRRHSHLLVYPTTYEGLEDSPYVIYLGGAPNQQAIPAVKWAFAFLGKRKFFLVGVDGIYSRTIHEMIRDELKRLGGEVVGEGFRPLGNGNFDDISQEVVDSEADAVINTVSGSGNVGLFRSLRAAGITSEKVPTISLKVGEEELHAIADDDTDLTGDYAAWSYFESLENQDNQDFLTNLRDRYGPARVATDPMAAAYSGIFLWARAVQGCESDRVAEIREEIVSQGFEAPEGEVWINEQNRHAWRRALVGQVNEDLQFDVVWSSPKPLPPEPFPATRSREKWEEFQRSWYRKWGNNWRPDAPHK